MNVGKWYVLGLAIVVVAAAGRLARAEEGQPSRQTLSEMGLGSLVVMSDDDAATVRGRGFMGGGSHVQVVGSSFATINGQNAGSHSDNSYAVSGRHFAAGANGSVAGVIHVSTGGNGGMGNGGNGTWKPKTRGNMNGGSGGGYGGGNGGSRVNVRATVFFAGGFSVGVAH